MEAGVDGGAWGASAGEEGEGIATSSLVVIGGERGGGRWWGGVAGGCGYEPSACEGLPMSWCVSCDCIVCVCVCVCVCAHVQRKRYINTQKIFTTKSI